MAAPKAHEIGADTCFWSRLLPDAHLLLDLALPYRVYVLGCGDYTYVGFEHRSKVGGRIRDHFAGRGAHFTKAHGPTEVLGVWTVQHAGAEAYVFALLLAMMGAGHIHRLGGYTQTSVAPSPLCKQQYERERRLLKNLCFRCGGNHWAKGCDRPEQGVEYRCNACSQRLLITGRGQSVLVDGAEVQQGVSRSMSAAAVLIANEIAPPPPQVGSAAHGQPAVPVAKRRLAQQQPPAEARPMKTVKTSDHTGKTVLICGQKYTTVSWYLGKANPAPKTCKKIQQECAERAVEIRNGDVRSLVQAGYAGLRPKELLPGRRKLSSGWIQTAVHVRKYRGEPAMELRLARGPLSTCRQVLFSVRALEASQRVSWGSGL